MLSFSSLFHFVNFYVANNNLLMQVHLLRVSNQEQWHLICVNILIDGMSFCVQVNINLLLAWVASIFEPNGKLPRNYF